MYQPTYIEIDSRQFTTNLRTIRELTATVNANTKFCFPVKANAYGHGLIDMAVLAEPYVDYFGVSCLNEGVLLRQGGITKPIMAFGSFSSEQLANLITANIEVSVPSLVKAREIADTCKHLGRLAKVHLKIDTGMNRVGLRVESAYELLNYALKQPELIISGIYSHLARSDEVDKTFTLTQIAKFTKLVEHVKTINPDIICHLANSGGVCSYPESYFDMVRPGILSYGYFPANIRNNSEESIISPLNKIKPCFSLKSTVNYTKKVEANCGIGYNHTYVTKSATHIATIAIGYGDGYRRNLSNCGEVLIRGRKYTVSGTICMDMLMVDVGNEKNAAHTGDVVVLIGKQGNSNISLESVADKCQTITYEILCNLSTRIPRIYL